MTRFETDYLVVGSGAVGMAFADTLLSDTDAHITLVDRHAKPGGHWNVAYSFVTLHQPSSFYGVASRELSSGKLDQCGLNKGLASLASGAEVSAYFDRVMQERFLPSGRVKYFPMSDYLGDGKFQSLLGGKVTEVVVKRKFVDATYLKTRVPSTHQPGFSVDDCVRFMAPNGLPDISDRPAGFVVIGGGKTAMDSCIWLLSKGVSPDRITWIVPRDSWLIDRRNTQPDVQFFQYTLGSQALQLEACAEAGNVEDLFDRLEASGVLLRIDCEIRPTMFHAATISQAELTQLRRIRNVVRMGRVSHIGLDEIRLMEGSIKTTANTVHVDCTASAISNLETKSVFQDNLITPQTVRSYQPVFSASLIAHVEATRENEAEKNQLCGVVPLPNHDTDWVRMMIPFMMNQHNWSHDPELRVWLEGNRLDGFTRLVRNIAKDDHDKLAIMKRLHEASMPAMANLKRLGAEL